MNMNDANCVSYYSWFDLNSARAWASRSLIPPPVNGNRHYRGSFLIGPIPYRTITRAAFPFLPFSFPFEIGRLVGISPRNKQVENSPVPTRTPAEIS